MGLSVVHGIVKSHGGTITAYSEPEKGTVLNVYFPVIETGLLPEVVSEEPLPAGSERILFVDDEQAIVQIGRRMLESLGYKVITKTNSIEALELFKAKADRFDLVITDMTMPQMTGEKLAIELMTIRPDIPVILSSGFSSKIDKSKAKLMGIRAFVSKPATKREFAEIIRKVLDGE
jgi:CheY-like chemotaxis protein